MCHEPLPVRSPGNGPETAEIETPTYNAVLPGPGTGTVLTGALTEPATGQGTCIITLGQFTRKTEGNWSYPLVGSAGQNEYNSTYPSAGSGDGTLSEGRGRLFSTRGRDPDSTFWSDNDGCVWRRITVIHLATGAFAVLYGRVIFGGVGALLQAFEVEFMPLPEVFPTIPGYTASIEGVITGVVLQLQGTDHAIFPSRLSYATTRDGN